MRSRSGYGGWLGQGVLGVVALVWLFPYLWMGLTSLKPLAEIISAPTALWPRRPTWEAYRSEEHTSELQSQSHISYAVFCLIGQSSRIDRKSVV